MEIANDEPLVLLMDGEGHFKKESSEVTCKVYVDKSLNGEVVKWNLLSIITNESFELEFARQFNVTNALSDRELFALEFHKVELAS